MPDADTLPLLPADMLPQTRRLDAAHADMLISLRYAMLLPFQLFSSSPFRFSPYFSSSFRFLSSIFFFAAFSLSYFLLPFFFAHWLIINKYTITAMLRHRQRDYYSQLMPFLRCF